MGRLLGAHDSDELDRPDLNKCPDCGCFFEQDNCPFCGKECPEEFRAGNRKAVKKKKANRTSSSRVVFVEWYHSWWFIAIMFALSLVFGYFPIVSIVLLLTSPHKTSHKVIFSILAVVLYLFFIFGTFFVPDLFKGDPIDTSLTKEEYVSVCETVTPETFYRSAATYAGEFVTLTLTVEGKYTEHEGYYSNETYNTYYLCSTADGGDFKILVRDCVQDNPMQFITGDTITVYGEGQGVLTIHDLEYTARTAPTVFAAYIELK
ncbi:MAG: hypothetical protein IJ002_03760 [Clostridia bacterium]|nr:hypothetical protein [Clostridia bacterium]